MCLYIDPYDFDGEWLDDGTRTARKEHRCQECRRTIDPGETYHYWTWAMDGTVTTDKLCGHCMATVALGAGFTGCPPVWTYGALFDLDPEIGFVGNILHDEGHDLTPVQRAVMHACVEGSKAQWRRDDGTLRPIPSESDGRALVALDVFAGGGGYADV